MTRPEDPVAAWFADVQRVLQSAREETERYQAERATLKDRIDQDEA
jgi:hypothetical protein